MNLRAHRHALLGLTLAIYAAGVAVACSTGIPSALCVSHLLVAVLTWAYGPWAGVGGFAAAQPIEFAVLTTILDGASTPGTRPLALLIPVWGGTAFLVAVMTALRRAELRQAEVEAALREKNAQLAATLAEVRELRGLLPICAWCKSVRDEGGYWDRLESYLGKHSCVTLTHGICPPCLEKMKSEVAGGLAG